MFDTTAGELSPLELTVIDETSGSGEFIGRYKEKQFVEDVMESMNLF